MWAFSPDEITAIRPSDYPSVGKYVKVFAEDHGPENICYINIHSLKGAYRCPSWSRKVFVYPSSHPLVYNLVYVSLA